MKKILKILRDFFEELFKNIPRIFVKYFPKSSHKSSQNVSRCGLCYAICTRKHLTKHETQTPKYEVIQQNKNTKMKNVST
jgi:hypothetical protein